MAHYALLKALDGMIFLLAHLPPKAANLDTVILMLNKVETILVAPRIFLRWLWQNETTPQALNIFLIILNSLLWGILFAVLLAFKRKRQN